LLGALLRMEAVPLPKVAIQRVDLPNLATKDATEVNLTEAVKVVPPPRVELGTC
jgi:hypothetical protein